MRESPKNQNRPRSTHVTAVTTFAGSARPKRPDVASERGRGKKMPRATSMHAMWQTPSQKQSRVANLEPKRIGSRGQEGQRVARAQQRACKAVGIRTCKAANCKNEQLAERNKTAEGIRAEFTKVNEASSGHARKRSECGNRCGGWKMKKKKKRSTKRVTMRRMQNRRQKATRGCGERMRFAEPAGALAHLDPGLSGPF